MWKQRLLFLVLCTFQLVLCAKNENKPDEDKKENIKNQLSDSNIKDVKVSENKEINDATANKRRSYSQSYENGNDKDSYYQKYSYADNQGKDRQRVYYYGSDDKESYQESDNGETYDVKNCKNYYNGRAGYGREQTYGKQYYGGSNDGAYYGKYYGKENYEGLDSGENYGYDTKDYQKSYNGVDYGKNYGKEYYGKPNGHKAYKGSYGKEGYRGPNGGYYEEDSEESYARRGYGGDNGKYAPKKQYKY